MNVSDDDNKKKIMMSEEMNPASDARILVFDLCPLFREALADCLRRSGAGACWTARLAKEVLRAVGDHCVNCVLVDLDAGSEALELLERIKTQHPQCRCAMMTSDGAQPELMAAIRLQADGFVSKRLEADALVREVRRIVAGEMVISDALTNALAVTLRNVPYLDGSRDVSELSPRELEVLKCVANGMSNKLISEKLSISDGTVKVHVKHLLKKLHFTTRVEAALWASEHGHR